MNIKPILANFFLLKGTKFFFNNGLKREKEGDRESEREGERRERENRGVLKIGILYLMFITKEV